MADETVTGDKKSNANIIKEYFGVRENSNLKEFLEEYKALAPHDREQLAKGIKDGTLTY